MPGHHGTKHIIACRDTPPPQCAVSTLWVPHQHITMARVDSDFSTTIVRLQGWQEPNTHSLGFFRCYISYYISSMGLVCGMLPMSSMVHNRWSTRNKRSKVINVGATEHNITSTKRKQQLLKVYCLMLRRTLTSMYMRNWRLACLLIARCWRRCT